MSGNSAEETTAMTPEERDIITNFISRVGGAQAAGGFGSVPSTAPALPPIDHEADALIADLFNHYPEARYRLTQLAFVQEHALTEAQNRIKQLQWQVEQAQQAAQQAAAQAQAQAQPQPSRGFLGGLFGGSQAPQQPRPQGPWGQGAGQMPSGMPQGAPPGWQGQPPPPQYAPGYQPGMLQRQGSGFLGSALTTAAGVAGGLVVGNALMDMFSPHREAASGLLGGGASPLEGAAAASPWGGAEPLPVPPIPPDQGPDQGYVDPSAWTTPDPTSTPDNSWAQPDQSGWADNSGGDWSTDNSGGSDDNLV